MALNIKNAEADELAHQLAEATGESLTQAVIVALRERLAAVRRGRRTGALRRDDARIQSQVAALPDRDTRTDDEIVGYDAHGLPQ